jgi:2-oxoglutarate/2-oxoacid ferredoxin oxidoreductase subunit beta
MKSFLNTNNLPYCKGCGHDLIAKNTGSALEKIGISPLDVIVVTDIGCHGIIDSCLNSHTVHGLHGRSVAIAAGIAMAIDDRGKKIIVFIGDGGSTIGLPHILEASRLNLNMTVVVHNNMLYGMTGGQTSGLTPCGFRTTTSGEGNPYSGYDICALARTAGARYVSRIAGVGDISSFLEEAFRVKGFSLIEVIEICPSYGVKLNPKRKLSEIIESSGKLPGKWENERNDFNLSQGNKTADLIKEINTIYTDCSSGLKHPLSVIISGSAGEGVQLAAAFFSGAAVRSGLDVTQKGSYPVTVGVGFSTAELVISPENIRFHGIEIPDVVIVTSVDGLAHVKSKIEKMEKGLLIIDSSLTVPTTGAMVYIRDFRSIGARSACLLALFFFASETGYLSASSLFRTIEEAGFSGKVPVDKIRDFVGYSGNL